MPPPPSDRLTFSTWGAGDIDRALELWGDPKVTALIDARGALTQEQVEARLAEELSNEADHGVQYWPMALTATNEFVGCCGLRPRDPDRRVFEIGFHVVSAQWGNGFATEAARQTIRHAFDDLGVLALFAGHNPKNEASAKLLAKLGFDKTHDELYPPTGLMHPSYLLVSPNAPRMLAVDVAYDDQRQTARAAGVLFADWSDGAPAETHVVDLPHDAPYVPGELYRRELPGILAVVDHVRKDRAIETVIVDGYVNLGNGPGLGAHLGDALRDRGVNATIIGVAKSAYPGAPAVQVLRGQSARPLFVSAEGIDADEAARLVEGMHGPYRIPTVLADVDRLTR